MGKQRRTKKKGGSLSKVKAPVAVRVYRPYVQPVNTHEGSTMWVDHSFTYPRSIVHTKF